MKYLGIDFGLKRIGLAVSEGELASPWKILEVRHLEDAVDKIKREVVNEGIDILVMGIPDGNISKYVKKLKILLQKNDLEVIINDETLSTHQAIDRMIDLNVSKKRRKFNDDYSAAEILQDFLDKQKINA